MGARPKSSDYKATEAEKASASVAMAEYRNFKEKYDPLLQQMRDESLTADATTTLRGRANADTMQALTSTPNYQQTQRNTAASDMSQAVLGQLGQANVLGKDIQNKAQTNVLGIARGQAADAQSGMAQASRLATSDALTRARANQDVAQARLNAAAQIGSALGQTGYQNIQGNGTFFEPNMNVLDPTKTEFKAPKSLAERLRISQARGVF